MFFLRLYKCAPFHVIHVGLLHETVGSVVFYHFGLIFVFQLENLTKTDLMKDFG